MSTERVRQEFNVAINSDLDLLSARQRARTFVHEMGFSPKDVTGIVTVISELARNMLMYANGGEIVVQSIDDGMMRGVCVIARDSGPGIPDTRRALMDGYSTSGSLGMGLPGIRRLVDDFQIQSVLGNGTKVEVRKWLDDPMRGGTHREERSIRIGVAMRPLRGQTSIGDRFVIQPHPGGVLFGVIDGLGHGFEAASAAETAVSVLKTHSATDFTSLLEFCHAKLRGTRGAVMTVGDLTLSSDLLRWIGVGDVLGVVARTGQPGPAKSGPARTAGDRNEIETEFLVGRSGVVGDRLPQLQFTTTELRRGDTVILATDGIDPDFVFRERLSLEPQQLAERILDGNAIETDDSLVLVVRYIGDERASQYN